MSSHSHDEKSHGHAHGPGCDHGCEHGHEHSGCEHGHDEKKTDMDSLKTSLESSSNLEQKVHMLRAEACLANDDFAGALRSSSQGLANLPDVANLLVVKGRALLSPLLDRLMNDQPWRREEFNEIWESFRLAHLADRSNAPALMEIERLSELMKRLPPPPEQPADEATPWYINAAKPKEEQHKDLEANTQASIVEIKDVTDDAPAADVGYDVIIVGAGAAGIGTAFMLSHVFGLDPSRVVLLDRGERDRDEREGDLHRGVEQHEDADPAGIFLTCSTSWQPAWRRRSSS